MSRLLPPAIARYVTNPGSVATPQEDADAWVAASGSTGRPLMIRRISASTALTKRLTAALDARHATLAPFHQWMEHDGSVYTFRDIIKGKNLRQYWMGVGGRPNTETLRRWVVPLRGGLAAFHQMDIAHGGLSLDNIIVGEDEGMYLTDGGICDSGATHHRGVYGTNVSASADIVAVTKLIVALLPSSGPLASPLVRSRVEGMIIRCDSLPSIRELLEGIDDIASESILKAGLQPSQDAIVGARGRTVDKGRPSIHCEQFDQCTITSGSGGELFLSVRNSGEATLLVRIVATQHPWINVRQIPLPIIVAPNGTARIPFVVSAARLNPGDYRSQIFLSTNAPGGEVENLSSGWYRHTSNVNIRITMGHY